MDEYMIFDLLIRTKENNTLICFAIISLSAAQLVTWAWSMDNKYIFILYLCIKHTQK